MTGSTPTRRRFALVAVAGASLCVAPALRAETRLRISGTGSGTGGMQILANTYMRAHPGVRIEVLPAIGSGGGIRAVIDGRLDLAVSNQPANDKETAQRPLQSLPYARTPFVVAAHRELGVRALSLDQLAGLYADGGASFPNGKRARPVLRLADATDTELLKAFGPQVRAAVERAMTRRGMLDAATDTECADLIERTPGAFGPATLAQIESEKRPLVALTIGGLEPTLANLASGRYPHQKRLVLVLPTQPAAAVQRFADYVQSPAARQLLAAAGHGPV